MVAPTKGTFVFIGVLTTLFFIEVIISGNLFSTNYSSASTNGQNEIVGLLVCSILGVAAAALYMAMNWHAVMGKTSSNTDTTTKTS